MTTTQLTEKVCCLVAAELYLDDANVLRTSRFERDLDVDPLDLANIALVVEERFGVEIPDASMEGFLTVGELCDYLEKEIHNATH